MQEQDHYRVLQVDPRAEAEVIQAAYRKLAAKYHPDVNPSPDAAEQMARINRARDVLLDPEARARYDTARRVFMNPFTTPGGASGDDPAAPAPTLAQRIIMALVPWFIGTFALTILFEVLPRLKQFTIPIVLVAIALWFFWLKPMMAKNWGYGSKPPEE